MKSKRKKSKLKRKRSRDGSVVTRSQRRRRDISSRRQQNRSRRRTPVQRGRRRRNVGPYLYCGNNLLNADVLLGRAVIGTNYTCLRKGYGAGFYQPVDLSFLDDYLPIDARKVYCGNNQDLPAGYDYKGNHPRCFQKGFAVGKRMKALRSR